MDFIDKLRSEVGDVVGKIEEAAGKLTGNEALQTWGHARQDEAEGHLEGKSVASDVESDEGGGSQSW